MKEKKTCDNCGVEIDSSISKCPECGYNFTKKIDSPRNIFYKFGDFIIAFLILMVIFNLDKLSLLFDKENTHSKSTVPSEISNDQKGTNNSLNIVEVIDFSSMSKTEIQDWCNQNKIICNFSNEYSDEIAKDGFISQSKKVNEQIEENNRITITYSLGRRPTIGEENALKKAKDYLNYSAFSRSGLIKQLKFEGFTEEEAIYGVDNTNTNWNEQAAKKAKDYLNYSAFSRNGLIKQLEFEGFTHEEAIYGVSQNGL